MSSRRLPALALVAAVVVLGACDTNDGRDLRDPPPGATAPPPPTSSTTVAPGDSSGPVLGTEAAALALSSPSFQPGTAIPARHTCDAEGVSPALTWTGVPPDAVELALTVVDPDAPGAPFVHLLVTGIDVAFTGIGEGGLPESAVVVEPWTGPCPPAGETHDYVFTLYALTAPSGVATGTAAGDALAAIESTPGAAATLTATYGRPA